MVVSVAATSQGATRPPHVCDSDNMQDPALPSETTASLRDSATGRSASACTAEAGARRVMPIPCEVAGARAATPASEIVPFSSAGVPAAQRFCWPRNGFVSVGSASSCDDGLRLTG